MRTKIIYNEHSDCSKWVSYLPVWRLLSRSFPFLESHSPFPPFNLISFFIRRSAGFSLYSFIKFPFWSSPWGSIIAASLRCSATCFPFYKRVLNLGNMLNREINRGIKWKITSLKQKVLVVHLDLIYRVAFIDNFLYCRIASRVKKPQSFSY